MKWFEKVLAAAVLGPIFPILGVIFSWWGSLAFLPGTSPLPFVLAGLSLGILVDIVFLRRWAESAYSIHWIVWMAVYIFYAAGLFGMFMGVPVFNLILSVPAGFFIGSRLARKTADHDVVKRMNRKTCVFTTGVLAAVCVLSAVIALVDPYTSLDLQRMLGLQFEVTRLMLAGVIATGGIALLLLQWGMTSKVIHLTYALMQTNSSALR